METSTEILEDIRDTLRNIAETISWVKWIIYAFGVGSLIALIQHVIKWFR